MIDGEFPDDEEVVSKASITLLELFRLQKEPQDTYPVLNPFHEHNM